MHQRKDNDHTIYKDSESSVKAYQNHEETLRGSHHIIANYTESSND